MNCANMLTLLLEAEPHELEGKGDSAVAGHVRECARCRAVAAQLIADTRVLSTATLRAPRPTAARNSVRRPLVWIGGLAAASFGLFLLAPGNATRVDTPSAPVIAQVPQPTAPSPPAESPEKELVPIHASRFADAPAATAVRFVASQPTEQPMLMADSGGVSVAPPAGTRSMVLATRNSKITVVWLY